jgi:sugar O-acyltransferase (sialic acid O-acetyltransferase NeuD family)
MKEKIILIGCGEHARMVIDNIEEEGRYEVFGLVTNLRNELGSKVYGYNVVCMDEDIRTLLSENRDIAGYFLGIGNMKLRAEMYPQLDSLLAPINIIHPTAIVSKHAKIGRGNIFEAFTKIANGAVVGSHCIINSFTSVNHDQNVGNNVLLAGGVSLAGKSIGDNTIISDGVAIGFKKNVGKNCIIGDGAVVTKDIPDNSIAYGNPAKVIRQNDWA